MKYIRMPQVMECINNYRNGQVKLSIKLSGSPVPYGTSEYLNEYGYCKVSDLSDQLDLSNNSFSACIKRFLHTFLNFELKHKTHLSMLYCNDNLSYNPKPQDINVIHQCVSESKMWIETLNNQIHEVELKEGDLLVTSKSVKVYRRKPNFFSRWADRFSTAEINYIQNIIQYEFNLSEQVGT